MKKLITGLFVVLFSISLSAQKYFGTDVAEGHRSIVLMNPTENNLKTILYLIDNQIFSLPADYNLVGFYSSSQAYDFSRSAAFIKSSGRSNLFLQECADDPGTEIYRGNHCSDDFSAVFNGSEGVIFFGGPDIPPSLYGAQTNLQTVVTDPYRHIFELSFLFHLLGGSQNEAMTPLLDQNPEYRILGICLGMQSLNVATGGTLFQDIPTEIYRLNTAEEVLAMETDARHRNYFTNLGGGDDLIWGSFHRILITRPDLLESLFPGSDPSPHVLSSHHQAAARIGKGLVVAATSIDGKVIEIMKHATYPNVLGVQFHPEPPFLYNASEKLSLEPGKSASNSFIDLYGAEKGETFNRNVWKWMGEVYK